MEFHVVGIHKEKGIPCVSDFVLEHPDDFFEDISDYDWYFFFLEHLKDAAEDLSCFSVFNDDGVLCAFLNVDQVLWFNSAYALGSEQDGLKYGDFYMLCIDFDKFHVDEG